MTCERCGNEISEHTAICPICGTASSKAKASSRPSTAYGQFPQRVFGEQPEYQQSYAPPAEAFPAPQINAIPPQQIAGYGPSYQGVPLYAAGPIKLPAAGNLSLSGKNDGALITEIILSLFGIFGVGWLMAGETAIGVAFLICSVLIYWPVMLLGTAFTDGLGLICLGPLAIAAIILNILLLNRTLKRKATVFMLMQQPQAQPRQIPRQPQ